MLLAALACPLSAGRLVVKCNLVSAGIGKEHYYFWDHRTATADEVRLLDLAVGIRLFRWGGVSVGISPIDYFYTAYIFTGPGAPQMMSASLFASKPLDQSPYVTLFSVNVEGWPWAEPKYIRLRLAADWTFWAANPGIDVYWRREFSSRDPTQPYRGHPRYDYLGFAVRCGLGGWYEFW